MLRKLLSMILRADLVPICSWPEIDPASSVAHITFEVPLPGSETESREQVLQKCAEKYTLFKRSLRFEDVERITFCGPLNGHDMRLTEWVSGPSPIYRLKLRPADDASVIYDSASPTWLGLWRNEHDSELGGDICFINSADREQLTDLRFRLLDGNVPESLQNEEEMWRRINGMSAAERRGAVATLAKHTFDGLDRKFNEAHPNPGAIPVGLDSASAAVQSRIEEFKQLATDQPVDSGLDQQIRQFIGDATNPDRRK